VIALAGRELMSNTDSAILTGFWSAALLLFYFLRKGDKKP